MCICMFFYGHNYVSNKTMDGQMDYIYITLLTPATL